MLTSLCCLFLFDGRWAPALVGAEKTMHFSVEGPFVYFAWTPYTPYSRRGWLSTCVCGFGDRHSAGKGIW